MSERAWCEITVKGGTKLLIQADAVDQVNRSDYWIVIRNREVVAQIPDPVSVRCIGKRSRMPMVSP